MVTLMKMPPDTVVVPAIAIAVAVICIIATIVVAIKKRKRTGNNPQEITHSPNAA